MLMEAHDDPAFRRIVNESDLVTPDGMPLVWLLRLRDGPAQERVYGPTLMLTVLRAAAEENVPVGFYGSTPEVLDALVHRLVQLNPDLRVTFAHSPPFRELTSTEDEEICEQIRNSGARILFTGLGCPKQERWMAAHRGRIPAVMLGVGAAFDFIAEAKRQAPPWIRSAGLEWLFRLTHEPRRLWRRYLLHSPRFVILATAEALGLWRP
jgi:N-acetylglucosaminyldiphosphoundecaprenol N-acetyl-beta-D-mannosaminyltransferase